MFQTGRDVSSLGAYQIRDKLTGEILVDLSEQPNFINTPGFNPYKILYDDTLEKGPAVLSILQEFKERDAPQIGPFQAKEDLGTNLADLGFGALRVTEPFIRGGSRLIGETFGIQPAKEFGGKQKFSPSIGLGGIDLFKPTYDSYVPTDQDRARGMVGLLKVPGAVQGFSDRIKEQDVFKVDESPSFDFIDDDIKSKVSQSDYDAYQDEVKPVFDPYNDSITPMLDELSGKSQNLKDQFEEDNLQRPIDPGRPPKPLDIADFSDELLDIKPVNVLKTEIDSKEEMKKKFLPEDLELVNVDTDLTPGEAAVINEEEDETSPDGKDKDPITTIAGKPGFFGSDNFLNFIRNVGGELVRTGQFGSGLASGAAKAAEERAARELLADQEERKYKKEIELAQAKAAASYTPDIMKVKDIAEYNNELKKTITDFQGGLAGVGFVDYAIEIIEEAQREGEAVGGFKGLMAKLVDKGFAFAGMGKDFDNLSADSKVEELTRVVKQKNLQAILGESGRTISDKDREIIERVFGDLDTFKDPNITLGLLRESRRGLAAANAERYGNIMSNSELLSRQGFEGSRFYTQLLPSLQSILNIDPYANQSAIAKARFAGVTSTPGVTKIGLSG